MLWVGKMVNLSDSGGVVVLFVVDQSKKAVFRQLLGVELELPPPSCHNWAIWGLGFVLPSKEKILQIKKLTFYTSIADIGNI